MPVIAAVGGPMVASAIIGGGTALAGGALQSKAAKKTAQATQQASDQSAATQRYIFDTARADNAVRQQAGDAATRLMSQIMGLNMGPAAQPAQAGGGNALTYPGLAARTGTAQYGRGALTSGVTGQTQTIGTGQYGAGQQVPSGGNALTPGATAAQPFNVTDWLRSTPGYQFNFDEGQRSMAASQAARGGLLSGDAGREAIRYGQNYGDRIYGDQFNRLAGMAGMGQTASGQNQQAGSNFANAMTNINSNNANALGSSYQNSANAWTNALGGVGGAAMWGLGKHK